MRIIQTLLIPKLQFQVNALNVHSKVTEETKSFKVIACRVKVSSTKRWKTNFMKKYLVTPHYFIRFFHLVFFLKLRNFFLKETLLLQLHK